MIHSRVAFGMIDVGRNDCAARGDFLADKLGRDDGAFIKTSAEANTGMLMAKIGLRALDLYSVSVAS
jgi:hypothetical protein